MKIGIHAMAWTNHWSNRSLDLIDRARALGMDFIEIPLLDLDDVDPAAIHARLDAAGFDAVTSTVLSAGTDLVADDAGTRAAGVAYLTRCVEATAAMGAHQFSGVIYSELGRRPSFRPDERHWEWAADGLRVVAERARDLGVRVALEPVNRYETFLVNTCAQAVRLCEMIGSANVGIHLDTYHMNIEETRWDEPIRQAGARLCHIHLCENNRGIPGTGLVDWDSLVAALGALKYGGYAAMESFTDISDDMRPATPVWRDLALSGDVLVQEGLRFLRAKVAQYGLGTRPTAPVS
jgi:D-psicose/D-tagatose/L-ribulose 3-epimerase